MNKAAEGDEKTEDLASTSTRSLETLQVVIGLLAGLAALVYIMGGAALGLRLAFAGLPTLPVGQLPREFLFSLGAAQIVVPAIALAIIAGLIELGEQHRALVYGHRPWSEVKPREKLRRTYFAYYATGPFLLIAPALAVAVVTDDALGNRLPPAIALGAAVVLALGVLTSRASESRLKDRPLPKGEPAKRNWLWVSFAAGGVVPAVFAVWWSLEVGDARYAGIVGAWFSSLIFALLVVWWRAQVGIRHRRDALQALEPEAQGAQVDLEKLEQVSPSPLLIVLSWAATAVLVMPGLVAITAAWPLSDAVVCGQPFEQKKTYAASGLFVGETKDRVYIGIRDNRRIVSVPAGEVSHLVVGRHSAHTANCGKRNGPV